MIYAALAPLVGVLITIMNGVNSRLSVLVGTIVAALVIHVVGLAASGILLGIRREKSRPGRLPFYYYLGGLVGLGTVFTSNYAFNILGASLAVALSLLGQTLFSVIVDAIGFLGRKKYPPSVWSLPGVALALVGIAVMAGEGRADGFALLLALTAGAFIVLSISLNSELGGRKGVYRATATNYAVGLGSTVALALFLPPSLADSARSLAAAGPFVVLAGGLIGLVVVTSMNVIFPRLPAVSATLLVFSGQAVAGLLIDTLADGRLDPRRALGTVAVLAGLLFNALLTKRGSPDRSA